MNSTDSNFASFSIQGMTCESCVRKITEIFQSLPQVKSAVVSLKEQSVRIEASPAISLLDVKKALANEPKYSITELKSFFQPASKSWFETYRPLITVFSFVALTSLAYQFNIGKFDPHLLMNHLMAGFFIGLSFFKFLDLKAFAESFSGYDPIAKKWLGYGYVYPFIELTLGLMFVAGVALPLANALTVFILSSSTIGVYKRLQSKSTFQCACLGTTFNLPLSNVTIAENLMMILMAAYALAA